MEDSRIDILHDQGPADETGWIQVAAGGRVKKRLRKHDHAAANPLKSYHS